MAISRDEKYRQRDRRARTTSGAIRSFYRCPPEAAFDLDYTSRDAAVREERERTIAELHAIRAVPSAAREWLSTVDLSVLYGLVVRAHLARGRLRATKSRFD